MPNESDKQTKAPGAKPEEENKAKPFLEKMRASGSLPAISENVRDICNLTGQSNACAVDLAGVIMRDAGLTSNVLATANSTLYSPRYPIKTVSLAVSFLGFEKIRSLALGLSLLQQSVKNAKTQKLGLLYASSYFSGTFAMRLARESKYKNPEEAFVVGLLSRLPWLALANSFPEKYASMEKLVGEEKISYEEACKQVFAIDYKDLCKGLTDIYKLPPKIEEVLKNEGGSLDPIAPLVQEAGHVANMLFGHRQGGKDAMAEAGKRIASLLNMKEFSISSFIKDTCDEDKNVSRFFNLDKGDVEMMVNALEWGKGNPAQITAQLKFGEVIEKEQASAGDPDALIGHFLTELMIASKKDVDINQVLMLAQEGLYRCLLSTEIFTSFFNISKSMLVGRFYVGKTPLVSAEDFTINVNRTDSPIIQCLSTKKPGTWYQKQESVPLHLPYLVRHMNLRGALFAPILALEQPIGIYFIARSSNDPFTDREIAWFEQIIAYVGKSFESTRKR
ncbi:MAG: hypothetical protein A2X49_01285 [Lentisphaerae bacterium GWF2_52_8]|nr:MAG: hypothetical protein A2X49_01285 [Lentisphaerae bacterium GWF2_52_8]